MDITYSDGATMVADRISLKCTQCGRPYSLFDRESIKNPPTKPICSSCERLIRLGLEEEK